MSLRGDEFGFGEGLPAEVEALLDALADGSLREEDEGRLYAWAERDARVARAVATTVWMTDAFRDEEFVAPDVAGRVLAETSKRRGAWLSARGMRLVKLARVAAVIGVLGMVAGAMAIRRAAPESMVMRPVETPLTDAVRAGVSEVRVAATLVTEGPGAVRLPRVDRRAWTPERLEAARAAALVSLRLPERAGLTERASRSTACPVSEPDYGCFRAVWVAPASPDGVNSATPANEKRGIGEPVVKPLVLRGG